MKLSFVRDLSDFLAEAFGVAPAQIPVDLCPPDFDGDLTINCFVLARELRRNPMEIASRSAEFLSNHPHIEAAQAIKAFVNVTVNPGPVLDEVVGDVNALLGNALLPESDCHRVLIEFSAPNTNKPQHLGHVRNNTIGMATASLLARVGHDVIRVNLVNDRGIHICKSMIAYQRFGNGETPASTGTKGDHLVGNYYVAFDNAFRQQIDALRETRPELADTPAEELFLKTEIGRAAQNMLVAWEAGEPEVRELWTRMNQWVLDGFQETYRRMGVTFDHTYLESETYTLGKDIVADGLQKGIFERRADGAVVIDFDDPALGSKVVLRSDGTSVYVTQDLGTTLLKQHDYQPNRQIWVVGDEQIYHFKVLFAILQALGYEWAAELTHMAYGMVNLPSGKMKSREGTVVDADDLFDEMTSLARDATLERAGPDKPDDLETRAHTIGMGALKFMLLKVNPKSSIMFDPEASIRFEGDTGPYVMYAYARISSMLRKADQEAPAGSVNWALLNTDEERELALRCGLYGDVVRRAAASLDTSSLATYLLEVAKCFSQFYRCCPVIAAENADLCQTRLALCRRVRTILGDGLDTLTIGVLESM